VSTRLETARLVIPTFEPYDANAWIAMFDDPEVRRFLPPGPAPTMQTFQGALEGRHAKEREGGYAIWAVDEKPTGTFVGQRGLRPVESVGPQAQAAAARRIAPADSSIWPITSPGPAGTRATPPRRQLSCSPTAWGRSALAALLVAMPDNVGSWKVMEKAGMRHAGLADYYGLTGLRKYIAEPEWWTVPPGSADA